MVIFEDIRFGNKNESEIKNVINKNKETELESEQKEDALFVVSKIEMFNS